MVAIIGILWGMVVCLVLVVAAIEVYHCYLKKNVVAEPYKEGKKWGLIIGVVVAIIMTASSSGESGLIAIGLFPFVLLGFYLGGLLIGAFYSAIGRTLIKKKPH